MSADLIRWTGGPGSGKTHQLLEDVRREVEDGRTPGRHSGNIAGLLPSPGGPHQAGM